MKYVLALFLLLLQACQIANVSDLQLKDNTAFSTQSFTGENSECLNTLPEYRESFHYQAGLFGFTSYYFQGLGNSWYLGSYPYPTLSYVTSKMIDLPTSGEVRLSRLYTNGVTSHFSADQVKRLRFSLTRINQQDWLLAVNGTFIKKNSRTQWRDLFFMVIIKNAPALKKGSQISADIDSLSISNFSFGLPYKASGRVVLSLLEPHVKIQFQASFQLREDHQSERYKGIKESGIVSAEGVFVRPSNATDKVEYSSIACSDQGLIYSRELNAERRAEFATWLQQYYDKKEDQEAKDIFFIKRHLAPTINTFKNQRLMRADYVFSPRDRNGSFDHLIAAENSARGLYYYYQNLSFPQEKYVLRPLLSSESNDFSQAKDIPPQEDSWRYPYLYWDGTLDGVCLQDGYYELLLVPKGIAATQIQAKDILRRDRFYVDNTPPMIQSTKLNISRGGVYVKLLLQDPVYAPADANTSASAGIYTLDEPFDAEKVKRALSIEVVPKLRGTVFEERASFWTQQNSRFAIPAESIQVQPRPQGLLEVNFPLPYNMQHKNLEVRIVDRVDNMGVYLLSEDWPEITSQTRPTPTPDPSTTPTPDPTPTADPTPTPTPDPTPEPTPEPTPSIEPSSEPSSEPSWEPSPSATP